MGAVVILPQAVKARPSKPEFSAAGEAVPFPKSLHESELFSSL
jgi:hypothetical protein